MYINPCLTCGACCKTYRVAFHWSETTPYGVVPLELTVPLRRHEVVMRGTEGPVTQCQALQHKEGLTFCGIHGRHPSVCREVNIGSPQCQEARARHGFSYLTDEDVRMSYLSEQPPATV